MRQQTVTPALNSLYIPGRPWAWDPTISTSQVAGIPGLCYQAWLPRMMLRCKLSHCHTLGSRGLRAVTFCAGGDRDPAAPYTQAEWTFRDVSATSLHLSLSIPLLSPNMRREESETRMEPRERQSVPINFQRISARLTCSSDLPAFLGWGMGVGAAV